MTTEARGLAATGASPHIPSAVASQITHTEAAQPRMHTDDQDPNGFEMDKADEERSPRLQIDPKGFKEALRTFFQPLKNEDPRLDFYTTYRREAADYDADYIKKYDEDLNTSLIFSGLFSAVSSAFVIDVYPKIKPDPSDQSAALLRAILVTLNQSAIPNESPTVALSQGGPPSDIVAATVLLYASLLISLLAAFIAMLGKQWLNRYLRHAGGSMIERCGDRQRKCDGLQKWPFHLFVETLPIMLQVTLLLLASGLCRYMLSINVVVGGVLVTLTLMGLLFYIGIVIAGASSYECPFQTPASVPLRGLWVKMGIHSSPVLSPIIHAFHSQREIAQHHVSRITSSHASIWNHIHRSSEQIQIATLRFGLWLIPTGLGVPWRSRRPPLPTTQDNSCSSISAGDSSSSPPGGITPWLSLDELEIVKARNKSDVRCVSWVLRNITDPEALDAAVRLAGTIWWFDDGINADPPYDLIVSILDACFGSDKRLYPGSRDRAYYSARAIIWINALATCKSEELSHKFSLPTSRYIAPDSDSDLRRLLVGCIDAPVRLHFRHLLLTVQVAAPDQSQWISNVLLHLSSAPIEGALNYGGTCHLLRVFEGSSQMALNATLNCLLVFCTFLGSRIEEYVLKVQDKSDRIEEVLHQVSRAIVSALNAPRPQHEVIRNVLCNLTKLEKRPRQLSEMSYSWCAVIWENRQNLEDWEGLLLLSLEVGFRHPNSVPRRLPAPAHTRHHRDLADTVFKSNNSEAVADLVYASLAIRHSHQPVPTLLDVCATYIDPCNLVTEPFTSRLRNLFSNCVERVGHYGVKEMEMGRFVELLNRLHIGIEDMDISSSWVRVLLETIQSPEGLRHLDVWSWELLVELVLLHPRKLENIAYNADVAATLLEAREWDKLECWMGVVWIAWAPVVDDMTEDFKLTVASLFRERPGAIQKLTRWMESWSRKSHRVIPESFQQACKLVEESTPLDTL